MELGFLLRLFDALGKKLLELEFQLPLIWLNG